MYISFQNDESQLKICSWTVIILLEICEIGHLDNGHLKVETKEMDIEMPCNYETHTTLSF